jgi:hypothetical protein
MSADLNIRSVVVSGVSSRSVTAGDESLCATIYTFDVGVHVPLLISYPFSRRIDLRELLFPVTAEVSESAPPLEAGRVGSVLVNVTEGAVRLLCGRSTG